MKSKTALVTGGTSGVGLSIAKPIKINFTTEYKDTLWQKTLKIING